MRHRQTLRIPPLPMGVWCQSDGKGGHGWEIWDGAESAERHLDCVDVCPPSIGFQRRKCGIYPSLSVRLFSLPPLEENEKTRN